MSGWERLQGSQLVADRQRSRHARLVAYWRGRQILAKSGWSPNPGEMFKVPSSAKGAPVRLACEAAAKDTGADVKSILDDVLLAARLEHLIGIGGKSAREFLLGENCRISSEQIAKLCRRMPPFIQAKLKTLENGSTNVDSNPTGAFDTNGWGELRVRTPRFRAVLEHYVQDRDAGVTMLETARIENHSPFDPGRMYAAGRLTLIRVD